MKKYLFFILIFLASSTKTFALEIVYPKTNPCTINASSTFFIGSTNPTDSLKINDVEVKVAPTGAFAQIVPLSVGRNEFNIEVSEGTGNRELQGWIAIQLIKKWEPYLTINLPSPFTHHSSLSSAHNLPQVQKPHNH